MRLSPLAQVKKNFGSREKLVEQLLATADVPKGGSKSETKSALMGLSNQKLLRLWRIEQAVREKFGDREKLVKHIVAARQKAGHTADAPFVAKLQTYSKGRLLDLSKEKLGERPAKQTAEQKLAKKRGRKTRERALTKLGKKA